MEASLSPNGTDTLSNDPCFQRSTFDKPVMYFVLITIAVITMCGNLLIIVSVTYFRQLHTPTNVLLLSLAVADLLVGLVVLPFTLVLFLTLCGRVKYFLCAIRGIFDIALCTSSILHLCFISIDRYFAVCQPLSYHSKITLRVSGGMIAAVWVCAAVSGTAITFTGQKEQQCVMLQNFKFRLIMPFVCFCIPVVMVTLYVKIFCVAQRQVRSIHKSHPGANVSKMERKATRTLGIVMGVFTMCWSPFFLSVTVRAYVDSKMPIAMLQMFKWLGWSNSMMNPFIYGAFYSWFRSAFRMVLTGKIFHGDYTRAKLL